MNMGFYIQCHVTDSIKIYSSHNYSAAMHRYVEAKLCHISYECVQSGLNGARDRKREKHVSAASHTSHASLSRVGQGQS